MKIKCIDNSEWGDEFLTVGEIYEVIQIIPAHVDPTRKYIFEDEYRITDNMGKIFSYRKSRFEVIE